MVEGQIDLAVDLHSVWCQVFDKSLRVVYGRPYTGHLR